MAEMLDLPDHEFKTTRIKYMLSGLMDNVDNLQKQIENVSRNKKILRKNKKEMPEIEEKHYNRNKEYLGGTH